jgi:hypothetical protein
MYGPLLLMFAGASLAMAGHYRRRIAALEENPVTRVQIVPRTVYDEQMGTDWRTDSGGAVAGAPV